MYTTFCFGPKMQNTKNVETIKKKIFLNSRQFPKHFLDQQGTIVFDAKKTLQKPGNGMVKRIKRHTYKQRKKHTNKQTNKQLDHGKESNKGMKKHSRKG